MNYTANTHICPECGAILAEGQSCQAIFDQFLALEFTDPGYGAVHFLTVACFMIQHGRYSDEGLAWIKRTLRDYLDSGMTVEQLRKLAAQGMDSGTRAWKVTRPEGAPLPPQIVWTVTIAQVAEQAKDASSYRAAMQRWARATLEQLEASTGRSG